MPLPLGPLPDPLDPPSDPESSDPGSNSGSKIIATRQDKVKPRDGSSAYLIEEDIDPQPGSVPPKTGRGEPKGES